MPAPVYLEFPASVTVLAYIATALLLVITILLFRMNRRIAELSKKLAQTPRPANPADPEAGPAGVETGSGSVFAQFLDEDPERRALPKKEQFAAYRKWRAEKGLNWKH